MPAPFSFVDRIDALVGGPGSVAAAVRALVARDGDHPVTKASDASRIPAESVRAHVVDVALGVVTERVREGLVAALREHFAEVRAEHECMEGAIPTEGPDAEMAADAWRADLRVQVVASLLGSDVENEVGGAQKISDLLDIAGASGVLAEVMLADEVLANPVADPAYVLARAGLSASDVDAIVAEIRKIPLSAEADPDRVLTMDEALALDAQKLEALGVYDAKQTPGWSVEWLGTYLSRAPVDSSLVEEGVAYVLTDPSLIETGAELLGLAGDAAFLEWATERAMLATPEEGRADVAEVLRLALSNEDETRGQTAEEAATRTITAPNGAVLKDVSRETPQVSRAVHVTVAAEGTPLAKAAGAALSVLYDHGCETDRAMAEALGTTRGVVRAARDGKTPYEPDAEACAVLLAMTARHADALTKVNYELNSAFRLAS